MVLSQSATIHCMAVLHAITTISSLLTFSSYLRSGRVCWSPSTGSPYDVIGVLVKQSIMELFFNPSILRLYIFRRTTSAPMGHLFAPLCFLQPLLLWCIHFFVFTSPLQRTRGSPLRMHNISLVTLSVCHAQTGRCAASNWRSSWARRPLAISLPSLCHVSFRFGHGSPGARSWASCCPHFVTAVISPTLPHEEQHYSLVNWSIFCIFHVHPR